MQTIIIHPAPGENVIAAVREAYAFYDDLMYRYREFIVLRFNDVNIRLSEFKTPQAALDYYAEQTK